MNLLQEYFLSTILELKLYGLLFFLSLINIGKKIKIINFLFSDPILASIVTTVFYYFLLSEGNEII